MRCRLLPAVQFIRLFLLKHQYQIRLIAKKKQNLFSPLIMSHIDSVISYVWQLGWYIRLPEGIQQEFPFKRALLGVKAPLEEEAESWKSAMFPSSTPRPCRHTEQSTTMKRLLEDTVFKT